MTDEPLRHRLALVAGVTWLVLGVGLAAGPGKWRSSPSYTEVARILPLRAWGVVFLVIGVAELVVALGAALGRLIFAVGGLVALAWVVAFLLAAVNAELVGVPALWLLLVGVHALLVDRPPWASSRRP
jgi:hypothetical protein